MFQKRPNFQSSLTQDFKEQNIIISKQYQTATGRVIKFIRFDRTLFLTPLVYLNSFKYFYVERRTFYYHSQCAICLIVHSQ